MNDADSGKLEEIGKRLETAVPRYVENDGRQYDGANADMCRLISTVKEQEQEIERQKKLNDRLAEMYADMTGYQAYQRRHRKWALKRGRHDYNSRLLWEAIAINLGIRTEKAEAELADFKVAHAAYGVEAERQIDEQQAEIEECRGRLLAYRDSTTELIASEQTLKAEREKLIGALADCCRMFKWCDDHYGAVLAEVKEKK